MKLPRKIDPDRIKDAIVEIRFASKIPFEVALGMFYGSLDDTYNYTNRQLGNQQIPLALPIDGPKEIRLSLGGNYLFFNDIIKFEIQPTSIIFNCVEKYPRWDVYFTEIEKVLNQLMKVPVIESFNRVGVRYISEYTEMELTDFTKLSFSFGLPKVKSNVYSFRSEFNEDGYRIIINLINRAPVVTKGPENLQTISNISSIDVDVIKENVSISNLPELISIVDGVHLKEKEMFFGLLTDSFLDSLNPEF